MKPSFYIEQVDHSGALIAVISGMGRNRGTWDSAANSLRTAQRWLSQLRKENPTNLYRIYAL